MKILIYLFIFKVQESVYIKFYSKFSVLLKSRDQTHNYFKFSFKSFYYLLISFSLGTAKIIL